MRNLAFLAAGLGLLCLQATLFRGLDGMRLGSALCVLAVAAAFDVWQTVGQLGGHPGRPRILAGFRVDLSLPAMVLVGYALVAVVGRAHPREPIPSLVLPLILFMGVHEYSLARGAGVAFALGYATDVLGIAPVGLYTFTYVATYLLARAARRCGSRRETSWMQVLLVGAFTLLQSTMLLVLLAIFGRDAWVPLAPLYRARAAARARDRGRRARGLPALPGCSHAATASSGAQRSEAGRRRLVSDLLVARSDVGEFRGRYKWLALFATPGVPRRARARRLHARRGGRRRLRGHRAREHHPPGDPADDARGHPRLGRQGARVDAPLVRRRGRCPVASCRARGRRAAGTASSSSTTPTPGPSSPTSCGSTPRKRRVFEARVRAACASDDDKSPCWRTPILVHEDVPRDIVAELKQHTDELAGVDVVAVPVRFYPFKELAAHMLGYVAEIDPETLARFRPARPTTSSRATSSSE